MEWLERDTLFARAVVDFSGSRRECAMACVPAAEPGDYVVVHAGIAISKVDAEEAARALSEWASLTCDTDDAAERSDA